MGGSCEMKCIVGATSHADRQTERETDSQQGIDEYTQAYSGHATAAPCSNEGLYTLFVLVGLVSLTDYRMDSFVSVVPAFIAFVSHYPFASLCPKSITHVSPQLPRRLASCPLVTELLRGNWCNGFWPLHSLQLQ